MSQMRTVMQRFRREPPTTLAGISVTAVRDYKNNTTRLADGAQQPLAGPTGDLVMLDLKEEGNYIAVRPSGTESKVKFYMFAFVPAEQLADLEQTKEDMAGRLDDFERDLRAFAGVGS
jgi:phosphoglucomutase/phosphomannomutase